MGTQQLPPGVEINGEKLRIWFMWRGERLREPTGLTVSPKNIKAAGNLRNRVVAAIKSGAEDLSAFFPDSVRFGVKGNSFRAMASTWVEGRKPELKSASYVKYKQILDQFWNPVLGDKPLRQITANVLRDAVAEVDWSELSPKRWNDSLIPLRGVFALAESSGLIDLNPVLAARLTNRPPTPEPADPLDLSEIDALLRVLGGMHEEIGNYFEVAFFTGMRPGEQIVLRWRDVNFKHMDMDIVHARNLGVTSSTKTSQMRTHKLNSRALMALQRQQKLTGSLEYVFRHPVLLEPFHEIRPLREVWWEKAFAPAQVRPRTLYHTRHTYATMCIMAGANPGYVAGQMGTSVELIHRTYAKWLHRVGDTGQALKIEAAIAAST